MNAQPKAHQMDSQMPEGNTEVRCEQRARAKTHLLVVEDEPTIRHLFATLLTSAGFSVSEAENGFAALEEVRRQHPALILSDLNMPRMTGFELLSVVRRRFPSIRVIAMSGAFNGDEVPDGVSADAFYEKSGRHINTLLEVIENVLADPKIPGEPIPERMPVSPDPDDVALWVTRRGQAIDKPHILLNCPECLRSFPHLNEDDQAVPTMEVCTTPCIFCGALIRYALLDPSVTHHPGYAPQHR